MKNVYNAPAAARNYRYIATVKDARGRYCFYYAHNDFKALSELVTAQWVNSGYRLQVGIFDAKDVRID